MLGGAIRVSDVETRCVATGSGPNGQLARYSVRVVTLLGQEIVLPGCRTGI